MSSNEFISRVSVDTDGLLLIVIVQVNAPVKITTPPEKLPELDREDFEVKAAAHDPALLLSTSIVSPLKN